MRPTFHDMLNAMLRREPTDEEVERFGKFTADDSHAMARIMGRASRANAALAEFYDRVGDQYPFGIALTDHAAVDRASQLERQHYALQREANAADDEIDKFLAERGIGPRGR